MKIVWNNPAFEKIRREQAVEDLLFENAKGIAERCGEGYLAVRGHGKTRGRAAVVTTTFKAIKDNAKNNTMIRNLRGSG